jgi:hypothetical protein
MFLTDKLIEVARAHAIRQRTRLVDGVVMVRVVIEKAHLAQHGGHGAHGRSVMFCDSANSRHVGVTTAYVIKPYEEFRLATFEH